MDKKISTKNKQNLAIKTDEVLFDEIRSLIEQTRSRVAQTVNSALVLMNWHIGKRIQAIRTSERRFYQKITDILTFLFASPRTDNSCHRYYKVLASL